MENYAFGAKGRTFDIAEAASILKYQLLYEHEFNAKNFRLVSIQHLKMFVGGKGNCKKELVLKEVFKRWGFDTNDNNLSDAYVLMQIGLALTNKYSGLMSFQKDILQRIKEYNAKNKI
jgi:crossover junction endodeoxyribonuclease RuvC